jgi:hypothetical protein
MTKYEKKRFLRMTPQRFIDKECEIRGCRPNQLDGWGVIQVLTEYIIWMENQLTKDATLDSDMKFSIYMKDGDVNGFLLRDTEENRRAYDEFIYALYEIMENLNEKTADRENIE